MTKLHTLDYYMDGHIAVAFCKICSAEGDKLVEDCHGNKFISTECRKMADNLNLHPDMPETWPMGIINRLLYIQDTEGDEKLFEEIRKMHKHP